MVKDIIDPRKYALGSITETYNKYPTTGNVLPAMGYGDKQMQELQETINNAECEAVVIGTPIDLGKLIMDIFMKEQFMQFVYLNNNKQIKHKSIYLNFMDNFNPINRFPV